ncbi:hypothetical protein ACNKHK_19465 [Shigella flexneri]
MLKEIAGCGDGGVNSLIIGSFGDITDALSVLQHVGALGIAFFIPQRRQNDRQY